MKHLTKKSCRRLIEDAQSIISNYRSPHPPGPVWTTAKGTKLPVKLMSSSHIGNCIKCLNSVGGSQISNGYLGGREKWMNIFMDELTSRN